MQVLVTGGAGFIGSHVSERLAAAGAHVRVLDNLSTGKRGNLDGARAGIELVVGDIRDAALVDRCVHGVGAIVHLAAVASVQASIDDPVATHETNFDGTLKLLEAARAHGVRRFVYSSSAAVYGNTEQVPVSEEAAPRPLSPYAADKLAGEHYLSFYHAKFNLATTAFRFFNIYGPRQDPSSPYSGVISIFAERIARGVPVTIFGDGRQTRDFVYVGDLVNLLVASLDRDETVGQVVNIGRGAECSLQELLETLERITRRTITRNYEPARVGDILRSCADIKRLRNLMDTVPATPIDEGLGRLLEYSRSTALLPQ
jgi:UDP-glucose 4-epimerase